MMEEVVKMPFIASCPGLIRPGSASDDIVANVDFAPTFLDVAGFAKPERMQGESFLGTLGGRAGASRRADCYLRYYVEGE